ncbi:MAG: sulfur carrier protein ThiS [Nitrospirales bacterium]
MGNSSKLEAGLERAKGVMRIRLNGEERGITQDLTVSALLQELDILPDRVVVEVNMEVLERQDFGHRALKERDQVEIMNFIGGGSERAVFLN